MGRASSSSSAPRMGGSGKEGVVARVRGKKEEEGRESAFWNEILLVDVEGWG